MESEHSDPNGSEDDIDAVNRTASSRTLMLDFQDQRSREFVWLEFAMMSWSSTRARLGRHARLSAAAAAALALVLSSGLVSLHADPQVSKADSDAMQRKILDIVQASLVMQPRSANGARTRQTPILERELNSYLRYELRAQVPAGVREPTVTIVGDGRVTGSATVDLDEVKRAQSSAGGWFDPMSYVSGQMPVTATGTLQTQSGTGRFLLESASISGVPIPKAVLQRVVGYYTSTPENPSGVNLDDAFELPARIQEIRVQPGQAIVVQ